MFSGKLFGYMIAAGIVGALSQVVPDPFRTALAYTEWLLSIVCLWIAIRQLFDAIHGQNDPFS